MPISGRHEMTLKINGFPTDVATTPNKWKEFVIESGGRSFLISVRPGVFKKLEEAQTKYPQWVAAIRGQLGPQNGEIITITEPKIEVFELKPRDPKPTATPAESANAPETP